MTFKKTIFITLLCFLPTFELLAGDVLKFKVKTAEGFTINYEVKDAEAGWVSVIGAKVKKNATLNIPEIVEYEGKSYTVVEIADRAFGTNKDHGLPFSVVELPSTIRRIGKYAFQWCERLESINLPEGLLIIDAMSFPCTWKLKKFAIPSSVIYIGGMAFQNWKPLYINHPKKCELENLPAIVTPYNCEQYGLSTESVSQYYATHVPPVLMQDINSDSIQNIIAAWNGPSDAKWEKRMKRMQIIAGVAGGLVGAAAVALPALTKTTPTVTPVNSALNGTTTALNTPSLTSSYSGDPTSTAYLANVQNRANSSMANIQNNMQMSSQQMLQQSQQVMNRMSEAIQGVGVWAINFEKSNGRAPTENEKDQWVLSNYPDVYQQYMSVKAALYEKNNGVSGNKTANVGNDNGVDYRTWYKKTEDNIASLHRSFSTGSKVSTDKDGNIQDKKDSTVSGGTYLQMKQTYNKLQKQLVKIREEAATEGITITPSKWEKAKLEP